MEEVMKGKWPLNPKLIEKAHVCFKSSFNQALTQAISLRRIAPKIYPRSMGGSRWFDHQFCMQHLVFGNIISSPPANLEIKKAYPKNESTSDEVSGRTAVHEYP
jgi:hypothetical protein